MVSRVTPISDSTCSLQPELRIRRAHVRLRRLNRQDAHLGPRPDQEPGERQGVIALLLRRR